MTNWQARHKLVPAVFIILERDGKILLMRRQGSGYFDGYYALPAGHIDGDEPATKALVREAKEELGVDIAVEDLEFVHVSHRNAQEPGHERIDLFFKVKQWQGEPKIMEPHKCDDLQWVKIDNLPEKTLEEIEFVLTAIAEGRTLTELYFDKF